MTLARVVWRMFNWILRSHNGTSRIIFAPQSIHIQGISEFFPWWIVWISKCFPCSKYFSTQIGSTLSPAEVWLTGPCPSEDATAPRQRVWSSQQSSPACWVTGWWFQTWLFYFTLHHRCDGESVNPAFVPWFLQMKTRLQHVTTSWLE